jgi:hypothetical protein
MKDIFRPVTEPARNIYDAFQIEALKRQGRSANQMATKIKANVKIKQAKREREQWVLNYLLLCSSCVSY